MPRVRKGAARHRKHKRILKAAKGYYGAASRRYRIAKQAVLRAGVYATRDRQRRKRLRSRAKRCLRNSSRFAVEDAEGWRLYHRRDYPVAELLSLVRAHRVEIPGAGDLEVSVARARRCQGGPVLEVREYRDGLASRLLPLGPWRPRGLATYAAAHAQTVRGGRGPRAVAAMVGTGAENRGRSIAVLELGEPP